MNFGISNRRQFKLVAAACSLATLQLFTATSAQATQFVNASFEIGGLVGWETAGDVSVQTASFGSGPSNGDKQVLLGATSRDSSYSGTPWVSGDFYSAVGFPKLSYDGTFHYTTPGGGVIYSFISQSLHIGTDEFASFDYNFLSQESGGVDYATFFVQSLDQSHPYTYLFDSEGSSFGVIEPFAGTNTFQSFDPLTPAACFEGGLHACDYGPSETDMPLQASTVDICRGSTGCGLTTRETGWQSHTWRASLEGDYTFYIAVLQQFDTLFPSALLVDNFQVRPVPEPVGTAVLLLVAFAAVFVMRRESRSRVRLALRNTSTRRQLKIMAAACSLAGLQFVVATSAHATQFVNASFEIGSTVGWETGGDVSIQTSSFGSGPTNGDKQALLSVMISDSGSGSRPATGDFFGAVGFPRYTYSDGTHHNNTPGLGWSYSFIRQNLHVGPDEIVSFDYNFFTKEGIFGTDYATFFVQSLDQPNPYSYLFGTTGIIEPYTGTNTFQSFDLLTPTSCYDTAPSHICTYGPQASEIPMLSTGIALCNDRPDCSFTTKETGWQSHSWRALVEGDYAFYIAVLQQVDNLVPSALLVDNFKVTPVPEPIGLVISLLLALSVLIVAGRGSRSVADKKGS